MAQEAVRLNQRGSRKLHLDLSFAKIAQALERNCKGPGSQPPFQGDFYAYTVIKTQ